jgi:hypothetical protein
MDNATRTKIRAELSTELEQVRQRVHDIESVLPLASAAAADAVAAAKLAQVDRVLGTPRADGAEVEERARREVDRETALRAELTTLAEREREVLARLKTVERSRESDATRVRTIIELRKDKLRVRLLDAVAELVLLEQVRGKRVGLADLSAIIPKLIGGSGALPARVNSLRKELLDG